MKELYTPLFSLLILFITCSSVLAQSNQYLHFDGDDDYIGVTDASQYVANSTEISFAGWFYTDELVYGQGMMSIRGGGGTGTGEMYVIQLANGKLECRLITTDGFHEVVAPDFSIIPQIWHHLAWIYDGSSVTLYIDGNVIGSTPASGTIPAADKPFTIGHCILGDLDFEFGGRADEVSLWSKALTQQEVQNMITNELTGAEEGLELYYKFNQGAPGEDNTNITKLISAIGNGDRDGDLFNFALIGPTSNFNGVLNTSFQSIGFPPVGTKLTTDTPFQLMATATSGLPVSYEVVSGPATVDGDIVTLTGIEGEVVIIASQPGDATYDPADDVISAFQVIDSETHVPDIDARCPLPGDVYVSELTPIQLAAITDIEYDDIFDVTEVKFEVNGESIVAKDWENKHYTGWWTPPSLGSFDVRIISTSNFGASAVEIVSINITDQASDIEVTAVDQVWVNLNQSVMEVEAELPCFLGSFDEIIGNLIIDCPTGGCEDWDRISGLEVKGHNGEWYEIIRYITPYGVPCDGSTIDLTDFMSALQGKIRIKVYMGSFGNGNLYSLDLSYKTGTPEHPYSSITKLWNENYSFGNMANLQPVPVINVEYPDNVATAKMKLISPGHGWGDNNSGNAAEFHDDTHNIWVDGVETFEQHNWYDCNPNPDGCQPQNGTWFHDRAGWCPGAIAQWFDYDMTPYINQGSVSLKYVFDEDYVDFCHPENPDCVSGVTCPNCNDGFNPFLVVASHLITKGDVPLEGSTVIDTKDELNQDLSFKVFPNPSSGILNIQLKETISSVNVRVINSVGQVVNALQAKSPPTMLSIDMTGFPKGIYYVEVRSKEGVGIKNIVLK